MRFTRFPRIEQPTQPSTRRVAAAKRAVQAEKDRYPLFPELVRYATTESRLDAMQEHRITWWQQHRNQVAASWREAPSFPQIITARSPHRDPPLLANLLTAKSPRLSP